MNNKVTSVSPIRSCEEAIERCKDLGMRVSRQRTAVLELLWSTSEHLCAREIYARLDQAGRDIGYTSVYQNLEALSRHGIIECLDRSGARLYGHVNTSHSHITCLDTDEIVDLHIELPPELVAKIEEYTGMTIADYHIDFYGHHKTTNEPSSEAAIARSTRNAPIQIPMTSSFCVIPSQS
jgi:Fur family transcriptional regulator, ferric uptake regulator